MSWGARFSEPVGSSLTGIGPCYSLDLSSCARLGQRWLRSVQFQIVSDIPGLLSRSLWGWTRLMVNIGIFHALLANGRQVLNRRTSRQGCFIRRVIGFCFGQGKEGLVQRRSREVARRNRSIQTFGNGSGWDLGQLVGTAGGRSLLRSRRTRWDSGCGGRHDGQTNA